MNTPSVPESRPAAAILHVEDEPAHQRLLKRTVGKLTDIVVASSLEGGLEALASRQSWLAIVVDLRLRDGSGWDLIARARETHPRVAIALYTALFTRATMARAVREHVTYLVKDMRPDVVRGFVRGAQGSTHDVLGAIYAVAQTFAVRLDLSEKQTAIVVSALCALRRGCYVDGSVVSAAAVDTHVSGILDKAHKHGLDFRSMNDVREHLMAQLTGLPTAAISGVNLKAERNR